MADSNGEFFLKSSELFESPVYLEEVADVLCILQAGTQLPIMLLSFSKKCHKDGVECNGYYTQVYSCKV